MKMDALKHQGQRENSTSDQPGPKSWTAAKLGAEVGDSATQVKRYIRLAELIPELLTKVDDKELALTPAVELAYLTQEEQQGFLDAMEYSQNTPSLSQAQRIRKLSQSGNCTVEAMREIMSEEKKNELDKIVLDSDEIRKYFPRSFSARQMRNTIIKLLDIWMRNRQKKPER